MVIKITGDSPLCGRTVMQLLKGMSLSTKMIKYIKYREDGIVVNGERVTVRHVLRDGDVLALALEDSVAADCAPTDTRLDVIYEDDELIVVSKPPFMPTHTSHGHYNDTLANALAGYFSAKGVPFVFRPINRLDRNTSGLVLVAKNKISAAHLARSMREHEISKSYTAILDGCLPDPTDTMETQNGQLGVIRKSLHRTAASIIVREVCSDDTPDAESAVTYYRILARSSSHTLVEAFPKTGRTHQLRVHFASLGCPITGDDLYGSPSSLIPRQALHARTLSFPLPPPSGALELTTPRKIITLEAPLPEDMEGLKNELFGGDNT